MAYNVKDVFYLDSTVATGTAANDQVSSLDISAYIDPIARGKSKAVGLAIYKVHWDFADAGGNGPVAAATTGTFRVTLAAGTGLPDGTVAIANDTLNAGNALTVSGCDFWAGGTAAGDPAPRVWMEPSKDVPYVVVRDALQLLTSADVAMSADVNVFVRLECAQITLDQATLNQLLRTQTV
jgi:hypothetical protein